MGVSLEERDKFAQIFAGKCGITAEDWEWRDYDNGSSELRILFDPKIVEVFFHGARDEEHFQRKLLESTKEKSSTNRKRIVGYHAWDPDDPRLEDRGDDAHRTCAGVDERSEGVVRALSQIFRNRF
jgi:hypothetical protein